MKNGHIISSLPVFILVLLLIFAQVLLLTDCQKDHYYTRTLTKTQTITKKQISTITNTVSQPPLTTTITKGIDSDSTYNLLLDDSFIENTNQWLEFSIPEGISKVRDGALYIRDYTDDSNSQTYITNEFDDFNLEIDVRLVEGANNTMQEIAFRACDLGFYLFIFSTDGYYALARYDGDVATVLVDPTYSDYINQGTSNNRVRIEFIGEELKVFMNDNLLNHLTDSYYANGIISLAAMSHEGAYADVAFDNLIIYKPDNNPMQITKTYTATVTLTQTVTITQPSSIPVNPEENYEIIESSYKNTDSSGLYWYFAWKLTIKNVTNNRHGFSADIHFLDKDGFLLESDSLYYEYLNAQEQKTFQDIWNLSVKSMICTILKFR